MHLNSQITPQILTAATGLLQRYVPELSPSILVAALKGYNPNKNTGDNIIQKPMTRKDAAEYLGVSLTTLDTYIRDGRIKAVRISERLVRIDRASVQALLSCDAAETI